MDFQRSDDQRALQEGIRAFCDGRVSPEALRGPMNSFVNVKRYPPADFRGVSAPNADTLYSIAWLDLSEPIVFSHPSMGKRFYLFEMVDLWMNVLDSPGSRTAGEGAATYLLTGPGWKGTVPAGMKQIAVATRYMVILGRTYAAGTEKDYEAVNADTDTRIQVSSLPAGLTMDRGNTIYVTEIYTRHDLITPLSGFGVTVPNTLYSIAYF